jgi:hypothetical protein
LPLLIHNNDNNTVDDIGTMNADAPLESIQQDTLDIIQNVDHNLQEETIAHLMSTTGPWSPHSRLSSSNVSLMDPPRDGNCLFQACCSKVNNCSIQEVTTNDASNMRHDLMEFLLDHANTRVNDLMVWEHFAMYHALDISNELDVRDIAHNVQISTLQDYSQWMRIATPDRCLFGNTPELYLIAHSYSLNVAVYEVDPNNPQVYILREPIVVNPNDNDNVIYLLLNGLHYQQILWMAIISIREIELKNYY